MKALSECCCILQNKKVSLYWLSAKGKNKQTKNIKWVFAVLMLLTPGQNWGFFGENKPNQKTERVKGKSKWKIKKIKK